MVGYLKGCLLQKIKVVENTPPTKAGKNNDCRQTNAKTVLIIEYIIFLTGPSKSDIKTGPL